MADVIFQMPFRNHTANQRATLPDEEALRLEGAGVVRIVEDDDDAAAEVAGKVDYVRPAVDLPPPPAPVEEPDPEPVMTVEDDGTVSGYIADKDEEADVVEYDEDDDEE